ncbi:uncharacterized protein I303_106004 [Kwoniella dejecticola CBS 10117]|uniref:PHD-type domain-containing protein n=1 Tax=Kwoniella dejecticola CBS 10117 TaxID=1296121 RepID=A0A1A6A108_9TREE|nr:uncharacterized protein I303_06024 [Kwoniella dejecticola CBS 10117]OBR83744.1 hypothetical protein I303_06024 [Kwoniella dejecticola CBS 10117]
METDHPQVAPSFIAKSENGRDQSLADGPPPPFASSSLSPATMQRPLPHHSQSFSPTHSSRPSLAGSVGEHSADGEVDRQKKPSRDGYWKMKEAEAASSASINKSHEYTPIPNLSHTANTDATQQELLHTPITGSLPPLPHIDSSYTSVAVSNHNAHTIQPKKRGRKKVSPPPLMTTKGISLVFRRPPNATPGHSTTSDTQSVPVASGSGYTQNSRASTPDQSGNVSVSAEGEDSASKKRRTEASLSGGRSTRNRPSPAGTPLTGSPAPSGTGALSIFAAPPPTEGLPEALQSAIPHGLTNGLAEVPPIPDADSIRKEAAAGFESRLRSRTVLAGQRRDGGERTGVSASGKDVRVGGTARTSEKTTNANTPTTIAAKKKGKGKADVEIPNQDFCSACRGIGRFLCCDGCPRSFHFMCLEPPLRIDELPEEEIWYCKQCKAELERELKPIPMTFKQLTKKVNSENPRQFRLPTDLISYFTGVGEAPHGEYVDAEGARMKYDRKGFQEDRDPSRLRDNKNKPIQCFHCGGSALPHHALTTDPESPWRMIVSCDYCPLSWHLDCLDPPLSSMPNPAKKWMCPNHTEQVLPRRRTIRNDIETVDVDSRNQPNNGNIVVIPEPEPPKGPALDYEDMVINRKKFRVPEKIIKLDFWEKCKTRAISRPSQEDMDAANLVLSLGIQHSHEPEKNQDGDMDIDVADDDNTHDPFPTPKSPDSTTNHNDKSQNAVKQPRIVLRMPAK